MAETISALTIIKNNQNEENEEDNKLHCELNELIETILANCGNSTNMIASIDMLKYLIRTSTTSMTSVPKPIKYLGPRFNELKEIQLTMKDGVAKRKLADIISILAMGRINDKGLSKNFDCLNFCLEGNIDNIGDWGHDYMRQLEHEIVHQWSRYEESKDILNIVIKIIEFDFNNNDDVQACDFLMEINQLSLLLDYVNENNIEQICLYLNNAAKYLEDSESEKIKKLTFNLYKNFGKYCKALIVALIMNDQKLVKDIFDATDDVYISYQMAFICARQYYSIDTDNEDINTIISNSNLSNYFINFAREMGIMEPKLPEDIYKLWLEQRTHILSDKVDSAKKNLASSFVNGFINCGFGCDKLLTVNDAGNKWIFRNKEWGMLSATASLGLIFLWDVDGGLTSIDKFLYSNESKIRGGALLAMGIVNSRVKNECDPAIALLADYVENQKEEIQIGAILGIGLAYAGTYREDVLNILMPVIENSKYVKTLGICSLACGLISVGKAKSPIPGLLLSKIIETNGMEVMKSPFMLLAALGVGLCYLKSKQHIDIPLNVIETLDEPFKTMFKVILKMCAYAGSGDVLIIQELLRYVEEPIDFTEGDKKKSEWDYYMGKALAVLGAAIISIGEEIGMEMIQRIFAQISRYGEPTVRRAVPLAIALTSASNPQPNIINILTKFTHDNDNDVACNASFGLGFIGAGSNNARLAQILRQLAQFNTKNPNLLFMVRISQGLLHLGKGTMTLDPTHQSRNLIDSVAMASIIIPMVCLIKPQSIILSRSHYLLYTIVGAIQPRWLLTLDENLKQLNIPVRVGQAIDVVAKAGAPKTIAGIQTHTTPILLTSLERAELIGEEYSSYASNLEGICILKKKKKQQP